VPECLSGLLKLGVAAIPGSFRCEPAIANSPWSEKRTTRVSSPIFVGSTSGSLRRMGAWLLVLLEVVALTSRLSLSMAALKRSRMTIP
jgi:hypothetical protein